MAQPRYMSDKDQKMQGDLNFNNLGPLSLNHPSIERLPPPVRERLYLALLRMSHLAHGVDISIARRPCLTGPNSTLWTFLPPFAYMCRQIYGETLYTAIRHLEWKIRNRGDTVWLNIFLALRPHTNGHQLLRRLHVTQYTPEAAEETMALVKTLPNLDVLTLRISSEVLVKREFPGNPIIRLLVPHPASTVIRMLRLHELLEHQSLLLVEIWVKDEDKVFRNSSQGRQSDPLYEVPRLRDVIRNQFRGRGRTVRVVVRVFGGRYFDEGELLPR